MCIVIYHLIPFIDKDLRFLRIGSLNVRVKKTTEAFSNFLGVGGNSTISPVDNLTEKVHKSWGSADNLSQVLVYMLNTLIADYFIFKNL